MNPWDLLGASIGWLLLVLLAFAMLLIVFGVIGAILQKARRKPKTTTIIHSDQDK